ncbi:hypothetical protein L0337_01150 [candidate division KSB1 bacterium]|nr:hypothetical protein [candidate division KSB1 bacterium]
MRNYSPSKSEPPPSQAQITQGTDAVNSNPHAEFDDLVKRNKAHQESPAKPDSAFEAFMSTTQKCLEKMEQILALSAVMRKESEERIAILKAREKEYTPFIFPQARKNTRRRTKQRLKRRGR